ncbi:unnamed protein product [Arctogadus glacialis]
MGDIDTCIDVFEDYIYGVTSFDNHVFRVNKFGRGAVENLTTGINHATDLVLFHRYKQPDLPNPPATEEVAPSGPCAVHCLHGGSCFLNARRQPKCHCQPNYGGERCEVDQCRDYCLNGGTCAPSPSALPPFPASPQSSPFPLPLPPFPSPLRPFSPLSFRSPTYPLRSLPPPCPLFLVPSAPRCSSCVPRCDLHTCQNYCQNRGNCTVTPGNQPTCLCPPGVLGDQCQYTACEGRCLNGGQCLRGPDGAQQCRCPPQYLGSTCQVDRCHYCRDGKCTPTNTLHPTGEVTCLCPNGRVQPSCYTCDTNEYCANGQCSLHPLTRLPECRCAPGWTGQRCETVATTDSSSGSGGRTASIVVPVVLLLLLVLLAAGALFWYRRRMRGAKGFQHQRMSNGAMNVEIGNPAYKIYEGGPDEDAGELLDADFTLDPDKPTNFTNPVYATLYMGAHNSRNSLASTDEKKELLSRGDEEPLVDPLA